jgi:hypothetical protein
MKYAQLIKAIDSTNQQLLGRATAAVNHSLVIRNWLIGTYIVEFEQHGEDRAAYGSRLIPKLARDLQRRNRRGLSLTNLKSFRQFFQAYPQIGQTLSGFSLPSLRRPKSQTLSGFCQDLPPDFQMQQIQAEKARGLLADASHAVPTINQLDTESLLQFSWSKLLELIRIDEPLKRAFYESECVKGNWSVRQL